MIIFLGTAGLGVACFGIDADVSSTCAFGYECIIACGQRPEGLASHTVLVGRLFLENVSTKSGIHAVRVVFLFVQEGCELLQSCCTRCVTGLYQRR